VLKIPPSQSGKTLAVILKRHPNGEVTNKQAKKFNYGK
jgi:hypothetical protein